MHVVEKNSEAGSVAWTNQWDTSMTTLHVHVRKIDSMHYVAWADEQFADDLYASEHSNATRACSLFVERGFRSESPDEAIGHLIHELWLGGYLSGPVRFEMDLQPNKRIP